MSEETMGTEGVGTIDTGSDVGGMDYGTEPSFSGETTSQVETPAVETGPTDPNLTPDNLENMRASYTQKFQSLSEERKAFEAERAAFNAALGVDGVKNAYLGALAQNSEAVVDSMIQSGTLNPADRHQAITRLNQMQVQQQQQQMNPYQNPVQQQAGFMTQEQFQREMSKFQGTLMEQMQARERQMQVDRQLNEQVSGIRQAFTQEYGREPNQQEMEVVLRQALEIGRNPLQHAWSLMNMQQQLTAAEARGRAAAMNDLNNGPDPWGATVPGSEAKSEIDAYTDKLINSPL